ncbi:MULTISPECIES: 3-hydroxyacyl-CoA dehydrogenase [Mogibacterium]|jgi:3-hydroxyacyl-CoA dehydrogenase|uniref:3-hydroxybutyryl-CoA dehydrogenase n=1 Tax=Mogibacterium timidum ATCC 33093 TaxID=1401079 RepID=X8IUV0_9FIRM|nr:MULTISPECIES: 3-hydroxyacyl-CoA dehydrogenase [Mogibacterium]EJU24407.1 3-hydroxybutyryl-CoA dehydrogenase [Mogibacterium sp. CM50]EUC53452.1 3-hydroxybutyryl-CoA dehydrogenase [Mogibacterium timidum ATCC 33093]
MNTKKVTVAGGGVLGSQIAFQSAFSGFDTTIWLRSEGSIGRAQPKLDRLHKLYLADIESVRAGLGKPNAAAPAGFGLKPDELTDEKLDELAARVESAYKNLKITLSLEESANDCDYYIESMAEIPEDKHVFYRNLNEVLEDKTIVMTNSSTLLPSTFKVDFTKPERYLALHFANNIWRSNSAEVMGHDGTSQAAYDEAVEFAKALHMVPIKVLKEQPGYLLNSMLVPFLNSAQYLLANGIGDHENIDMAWKIGTGAPYGPFQILDIVGLTTAYNIVANHPEANDPTTNAGKIAAMLKKYIDAGKTGVNAGEGFYKYR